MPRPEIRHAAVVLFLIACSMAPSARADGSLFIGAGFPAGDFKSGFDVGWTLGGYLTRSVSPVIDLGGTISYSEFTNLLGDIPVLGEYFGEDFDAWEGQALIQANFSVFRGYGALGVANFSGLVYEGRESRQTRFAWQLGIAAKVAMLEARLGYHQIDLEEGTTDWFTFTVGVVF